MQSTKPPPSSAVLFLDPLQIQKGTHTKGFGLIVSFAIAAFCNMILLVAHCFGSDLRNVQLLCCVESKRRWMNITEKARIALTAYALSRQDRIHTLLFLREIQACSSTYITGLFTCA